MKVLKIAPMKYDSFYVSLLSEKYKKGSTNFLKAFYIGFFIKYQGFKIKGVFFSNLCHKKRLKSILRRFKNTNQHK